MLLCGYSSWTPILQDKPVPTWVFHGLQGISALLWRLSFSLPDLGFSLCCFSLFLFSPSHFALFKISVPWHTSSMAEGLSHVLWWIHWIWLEQMWPAWISPWSPLAERAPKPCLDTVPILYFLTVQRSACHNTCFVISLCAVTLCNAKWQKFVTGMWY